MKLLLYLLGILLFSSTTNAYLIINEVMYDPPGDDNNLEYIEIISNETINLTDYIIQDLKKEDPDLLTPLKEINSTFALIVEEGFNYSNINASIYEVGAAIGHYGLDNNYEAIILKDQNSTIIDILTYTQIQGASGNGKSLCKLPDAIPDKAYNLKECDQTSGSKNSETSAIPQEIELEITEFLPDPTGYDDAEMPEGEFIELYNPTDQEINLIGFYFKDLANHKLTIDNTKAKETTIRSNSYLAIYTNGFSGFLNNQDLEIINLYSPEENQLDQVSYSSSQEGLSWSKIENIWLITFPSPNQNNEKLEKEQLESKIIIEKIYDYDNATKFGQQVNIKTTIYKGNTSKYSINAYIEGDHEKITKTSGVNLYTKFINYTLTIPVQIEPNCKEKLEPGYYTLIVEGLDTQDIEKIYIQNLTKDLCEETEKVIEKTAKSVNTRSSKEDLDFETVINSSIIPISNNIVYESKNQNSQKIGIYILAIILIIITLIKTIHYENRSKSND